MADYIPARLIIGGEVTDEQYQTIRRLTNNTTEVFREPFYEVWDDHACGGTFASLEDYLMEQQIAFDRFSSPALGYDGSLTQYRPGMREPLHFLAAGSPAEPVVSVPAIQALIRAGERGELTREALLARLQELCGPVLSPLTPFSVRPD
jgi:hypothetical protein